jgi:peptide deformylase
MPILKITANPDPILRQKAKEIDLAKTNKKKLKQLVLNMGETMLKKDGVGLAAPQVDQSIRLICVSTKDGVIAMVNPKITKKSFAKEWGEEGCLSVPEIFGQVRRHKKINCIYYCESGERKKIEAEGLLARIIQHEVDHLDGILFIDKAKGLEKVETK